MMFAWPQPEAMERNAGSGLRESGANAWRAPLLLVRMGSQLTEFVDVDSGTSDSGARTRKVRFFPYRPSVDKFLTLHDDMMRVAVCPGCNAGLSRDGPADRDQGNPGGFTGSTCSHRRFRCARSPNNHECMDAYFVAVAFPPLPCECVRPASRSMYVPPSY